MKNEQPEIIKNYRVIRKVSEGSSGIIYEVEASGVHFALKLLKTVDPEAIVRFRRETLTLARLNHKNLLKISDIGDYDGTPFFVTELLTDGTLADDLLKLKKIPQDHAVGVMSRVVRALGELHKAGLIHRDIKPANIHSGDLEATKLLDLGLVISVDQVKTENEFVGTPIYCSPEQTRIIKREVDYRSDLYSIGVVLFEILSGRPPFVGSTTEILQQHASKPAPNVRTLDESIRPALGAVIEKLLHKDPDNRYQSAVGLLYDLENLNEIDDAIKAGVQPKLGQKDQRRTVAKVKFVSRKTEADRLAAAWAQACEGMPGIVIVSGASGAGKTRLCDDFMTQIPSDDVLVLRSKCQLFDRDLPFGPISEGLNVFLEDVEAMDPISKEVALQRIQRAAGDHKKELLKLSKGFRKIFPDVVQSENQNGNLEGDREAFFASITEFFVELAKQWNNLIFFVDDIQWIDHSSRQLFELIFGALGGQRFLLLSTARDDEESKRFLENTEKAFSKNLLDSIYVDVFTKEQIANLINDFLGGGSGIEPIVEALYGRSKGNVFVTIEYMRAGLEQGFLSFSLGTWGIDPAGLDKIALSGNVFDLILKRINSASEEAKRFLNFAALYGDIFRWTEIADVSKIDKTACTDILSTFRDLALIEQISDVRWRFIHDKIRESLVDRLDPAIKPAVAADLATWLAKKEDKSLDEVFAAARLFLTAGDKADPVEVIKSQILAGDFALSNFAYSEAFSYYKTGYDLINDRGITPELKVKIAPNLTVCATMIGEEKIATECSDLHIKSSGHSKEELAYAMGIRVWLLNIQSNPTQGWEFFRKASGLIGYRYPDYLHWKILHIIWFWALSFLTEMIGIRCPKRFFFGTNKVDLNRVSNMYLAAIMSAELRGAKLDIFLVSLRLFVIGQMVGGAKERALGFSILGYVYGWWGLKGLATSYFARAEKHCQVCGEQTVTAIFEMKKLLGLFYCGVTMDLDAEYAKKKDFLYKYLSPTEHARLLVFNAWCLNFKGRHQEGLDLLMASIEAHQRKTIIFPNYAIVNMLNQIWSQLEILGRSQEGQAFKRLALETNYTYRHSAVILRSVLTGEISAMRVTEKMDSRTDEILTAFWKRRAVKVMDPMNNNVISYLTFPRLWQIQKATTLEEEFSARREFKSMVRHLFSTLYAPLFRANYYFLVGSYLRMYNKNWLAEICFDKAETLAGLSGNLRLIFDLLRDKARNYFRSNRPELAKMQISSAMTLAIKYNWAASIPLLTNEFERYIDYALPAAPSQNEASQTLVQTQTHATHAPSGRTFVASPRRDSTVLASAQSAQTQGMTAMANRGSFEQARVNEILLRVSKAFISSTNVVDQTKGILGQIVKLYAAERAFAFLKSEQGEDFQILTGVDSMGGALATVKGFSTTVVKKVLKENKPFVIAGTEEAEAIGSESIVLNNIRSIMAIPLTMNDAVIGVAYLDSTLSKRLFSYTDTDLFSVLANHISVAHEVSRIAQIELEKANIQNELKIQSAIAAESKKVTILVNNMKQGLFAVDKDGAIVEPASKFTENIFESPVIGKDIREVLYKEVGPEASAAISTAIETVYGADDLQWSLMEDSFPRKINYFPGGERSNMDVRKSLRVTATPIWDDLAVLERILFIVEDVTILEAAEMKNKANEEKILMMEGLLESSVEEFGNHLSNFTEQLQKCRTLSTSDRQGFLRELHTLKGNARLAKMRLLSEQVHFAETEFAKQGVEDSALVESELQKVASVIDRYNSVYEKFKKANSAGDSSSRFSPYAVDQLKLLIEDVRDDLSPTVRSKLMFGLSRLDFMSLEKVSRQFDGMVAEISKQLQKEVKFDVQGDALADRSVAKGLQECLLHLIRNSLDHGIESPDTREASQKARFGHIRVALEDHFNSLTIKISDDGGGINGQKVAEKAVAKGLITTEEMKAMSDEQKVNLIFLPNFSTKEAATDVSGRGVGMDVVKQKVSEMGGDIKIDSKVGSGSTFTINIASTVEASILKIAKLS